MKNVIKKITAVAMAFTMLGTGTAITKTITPKTNNSIVASAASYAPTCKHSSSTYYTCSPWRYDPIVFTNYDPNLGYVTFRVERMSRYHYTHCAKCRAVLYSKLEYKYL